MYGPTNLFSQRLHQMKYRQKMETFDDYCVRYARTTADDEVHFRKLLQLLRTQSILPGGRQQLAVGWPFQATAFNCFVGDTIEDSMSGIMMSLHDSALTLRTGGGCGWDFSTLRPYKDPISTLGDDAYASGPVSFMNMWDSMCNTIRSAGQRRGAMMAVLRVDHPDIMSFIRAKRDERTLTNFNISVGVTREFMEAVESDGIFHLKFDGRRRASVRALELWHTIMESNWDYAEPGVLFLDTINEMNPLHYCERINATNPCGEQPLPPNGACLLLSMNMVKYIVPRFTNTADSNQSQWEIDYDRFTHDVDVAVRACDNVFEKTVYPHESQRKEAFNKRRMGVGVTGVANTLEICGHVYASDGYIKEQDRILSSLRDTSYRSSINMARAKGCFPLFDADKWLASGFAKTLPEEIRHDIKKHGLRNGLLLSIAPTGTISLCADNVSSGIEPPYTTQQRRRVNMEEEQIEVSLNDYAFEEYGVTCKTSSDVTPTEHVQVLCAAQAFIDSAVSKTINVKGARQSPPGEGECSFADFKDVYMTAYRRGAKGCTTFNSNGKRRGIFVAENDRKQGGREIETTDFNQLCTIDSNGNKICG